MQSSDSEQSSDDSGSVVDPRRSCSVPNSLSQLQDDYEKGSDSAGACTPQKKFEEQDGLSDCPEFHSESTRPLSLPSAGAFPLPVHLKLGELLITIQIPMGSIAILYSNPLHPASVVSSARGFLGLLLRNGHLRNTIGRLPTKNQDNYGAIFG